MPQKTFNARQLEEKAEEVRICLYVAREMNRRDATDYYAKDPVYYLENRNEPIDVELFSKSDAYPPYRIQVVTAPSNKHLELRSHIKNVESLRNRLATAFAERGLQHCTVGISLGEEGLLRKIPKAAVTQCANLMVQNKLKEDWSLEWREIAEFSPTLHKFVRRVSVHPAKDLTVRVHRTAWTPSDERLIEESIRLKEQDKYPLALKAQTALVISGSSFIDDEQVQSYIASGKAAAITFSEAWIVFDERAVLLKQAQRNHALQSRLCDAAALGGLTDSVGTISGSGTSDHCPASQRKS